MMLAANSAATIPTLYLALALGLSLGLAALLGVFHPRNIRGPRRISEDEASTVMLPPMGFGMMGIAVTILGFNLIALLMHLDTPNGKPTPGQSVIFNCVMHLLAFGAIAISTARLRPRGIERLGLSPRLVPAALLGGILCIIIILPLVAYVNEWSEIIQIRRGQLPDEHYLLKILGTKPQVWMRWAIAFSAVVAAPLAEETFFRGGLQSVLRYTTKMPWLAIPLASACWALIHEPFERLPIFFLGLCLGYIYERTGNLWMCIVVHSLFNLTSIVIFWHNLV
jgi:membrane protease YdiL (CAAX protease family)